MHRDTRKHLFDIVDSSRRIIEVSTGRTQEDLATDRTMRACIYMNFVVIGEAMAWLKRNDPPVTEQISEVIQVIGFRNQIVHGYTILDHSVTWDIISEKLPILANEVATIMGE